MAIPNSVRDAGLNINVPLTNIAQGVRQPKFCMRILYPLVEVGLDQGQLVRFDDSVYEEVNDDRSDDSYYPEVQDGLSGIPYELSLKGFSYRVGDKKKRRYQSVNVNWGVRAQRTMMSRAGLKHEIEAAVLATTPGNYAATNRVALTAGNQFNDPNINPATVIRAGKSAVSGQTGEDPNVLVMGRDVYDALAENESIKERIKYTSRDSLTTEMLAAWFDFAEVRVCNAIVKRNGVTERVFGKHMVMGYTNPQALNQDKLPYRTDGTIDNETPSMGYTYTYLQNPLAYTPYYDQDRGATVYKLDFDRQVSNVGVNDGNLVTHGYFIQDAVA